ncbi:hypothetical protein LARI1_G005969 [Lachnellula arida]|uniref:N-acetyltransferase domain-containing protein n=1 Tax=Lachnellula arida TaxID=1316785 RepID=A0A8T9BBQ2_9HELO|nr:hypothetical protein LARI1_G005969 [Lachnellula arida]
MTKEPSFQLLPAERNDIPRLAQINIAACLPDIAFSLYFPTRQEFEQGIIDALKLQLGDPTWLHIKAVDKATGAIGGWASWNTLTDEQIRERDAKIANGSDFPPGLSGHVARETDKLLGQHNGKQRYMRCKALFIDPSFQKQGIGKALIEYGNGVADREHLPLFLQATPFGFPLYVKGGFEMVDELDIDLRDWAPGGKGNDRGMDIIGFDL